MYVKAVVRQIRIFYSNTLNTVAALATIALG
jgi:hypothetical protein